MTNLSINVNISALVRHSRLLLIFFFLDKGTLFRKTNKSEECIKDIIHNISFEEPKNTMRNTSVLKTCVSKVVT